MATRLEIRCINKTDRMNPHERIRNVGIPGGWKQSQEQTIKEIEDGVTPSTSPAGEVPLM